MERMNQSNGTSFWVWVTLGLIGIALNAFAPHVSPRASRPGRKLLSYTEQSQISSA